jgi:Tat protein translocase TatB subunit
MLGLGWGEILLVAGVALVVVGPERLPRLLRDLGRMYGQVRRAADDLRRSFVLEAERQDAEERYQKLQARRKAQAEARAAHTERESTERRPDEPEQVAFGGSTTVAEGTLSDDGFIGDGPSEPDEAPDPNADDPEAPHPSQLARTERP